VPDFRAVTHRIVSENQLGKRLLGWQINLGVEILRDLVQASKQPLADRFKVRSLPTNRISIEMRRRSYGVAPKMREILVQTRNFPVRGWRRPANRTQNHANLRASDSNGCRGVRVRLDWILDGADQDRALHYGNDDAAGRQARDGFLVRGARLFLWCRLSEGKQQRDCQRGAQQFPADREFPEGSHLIELNTRAAQQHPYGSAEQRRL
jgi:hypothetical protein